MKKSLAVGIIIGTILLYMPIVVYATGIRATVTPIEKSATTGAQITVPIIIDVSGVPETLGSYTAEISWDAKVLKYINHSPGTTEGFSNPMVNVVKAAEGTLKFAAANPYGSDSTVNVLNVVYEVIGSPGSDAKLELAFTAMSAARTFDDLLPYIETVTTDIGSGLKVVELPKRFYMSPNQPNPFNPATEIMIDLPTPEHVQLLIYNPRGQKIRTLIDEPKPAGTHIIIWDARDDAGNELPAGIYLYEIRAGSFVDVKKMLLVK